MDLGTLLSTILLVSFIVTIILAVGSYMAYKFRERRRPREPARALEASVYFERVDLAALPDRRSGVGAAPAPRNDRHV
jgi:heme/copper-type cytochrome/quinol oxidase subunit 2